MWSNLAVLRVLHGKYWSVQRYNLKQNVKYMLSPLSEWLEDEVQIP